MRILKLTMGLTILICAGFSATASDIIDFDKQGNIYAPKISSISQAQFSSNKEIQYMLENSSLPELARYAIRINQAQIEAAKRSGRTPPEKLTREILSDRDKIADYLRSLYKYQH